MLWVEYVEGIEVVKAFNQSTSSYEKYRKAVEAFKETTLNWYKSTWKFTTLGAVDPSNDAFRGFANRNGHVPFRRNNPA